MSLAGALAGVIYGFLLALAVALFSNEFSGHIVALAALSFALIGFFEGNVIFDAFLALLHFFVGLANGFAENLEYEPEREAEPRWRAVAMVGCVTGMILLIGTYRYW